MSILQNHFNDVLKGQLPEELVDNLLVEYNHLKQQFFLNHFQPTELNAGRFCECILRIIEYLNSGLIIPFGTQLNTEQIIRAAENNTSLKDTIRFFIPRLVRVLIDVRNKRDVAHVGGEVNPNYSDSLFVVHSADWLLTELVRHFHNCPIEEAKKIVESINEIKIPIVADVNGFIRIQNTDLSATQKTLVVLYYKNPDPVKDSEIMKWIRYKNSTDFRKKILSDLDDQALIHYESGMCVLLPKGITFVERNIPLDLII
jgi:hypothetical protein